MAPDESSDVHHTPQLLIFVHVVTKESEITEELAAMHSVKQTLIVSELFMEVENGQTGIAANGCPNLTGKNFRLLKWMQDKET